jgi:hypothetical protein
MVLRHNITQFWPCANEEPISSIATKFHKYENEVLNRRGPILPHKLRLPLELDFNKLVDVTKLPS